SGSLLIARTPEHADLVKREAAQSHAWGVELEMVDPAAAHRLMPCLEGEGDRLLAVCHIAGDVYVEEPASLLRAYLGAGRRLGVQVIANTTVTGLRLRGGAVEAVLTDRGEIRTPVAVDAAGAWARAVGELADAPVPVVPMRHQLYITEPIA